MHVDTGSDTESLQIQLQLQLRLRLGLRGVNVNAPVRHARPAHTRTILALTDLLGQVPFGLFSLAFCKSCECVRVCLCAWLCVCFCECV